MHNAAIPPPASAQRVTTITLQVEALGAGGLRLSTPQARGWAAVARTQTELAKAVQAAYLEVSCASYARAKGAPYDLDVLTTHVPGDSLAAAPQRRVRGRVARRKTYHVEDWTRMEDGRWRSPSGRVYREDTTAVRNVVRKRAEKGLPT